MSRECIQVMGNGRCCQAANFETVPLVAPPASRLIEGALDEYVVGRNE